MARQFLTTSSQYLESTSVVATATPLTFASWCYPTGNVGHVIALPKTTVTTKRFALFVNSGAVNATHHDGTTLGQAVGGTVTLSAWSHLAGVFASTASRTAYLNGVAVATDTTSCTVAMTDLNRTTIGRRTNSVISSYYNGRIAEAAIWGAALSDAEIRALAGGVLPHRVRPGSLLAYWPLWGQHSPEIGLVRGTFPLTVTGATPGDHAPVADPCRGARGTYSLPQVAAGGGGAVMRPASLLMAM